MTSPSQKRTQALYHEPAHEPAPGDDSNNDSERIPAATPGPFSAGQALAAFAVVMALLLASGAFLAWLAPAGRGPGLLPLVLAQLVIIGGVPVAMNAIRHGRRAGAALGLHRPSARAAAGALLCGATVWWLTLHLVAPLGQWIFGQTSELRHLEAAITRSPLPWILVALAVVPAVCEELLFRGFLLAALRPRAGNAGAIIASALLFALLHLTRIQLLPTLFLGLLLGYAAIQSGVVASMLLHAANNIAALLLATKTLPPPEKWPIEATGLASVIAAFACIIGALLLRSRPDRAGRSHVSS